MRNIATILLLTIILIVGCDATESPMVEQNESITLSIIETNSESVRLSFTSTTFNPDLLVKIFRVDTSDFLLTSFQNSISDTMLVDTDNGTGLNWETEYCWYAQLFSKDSTLITETEKVCSTTIKPDSTTSDFIIETEVISGDFERNSFLRDVWVFNEENIWAVGNIGTQEGTKHIIQWDGSDWNPRGNFYVTLGFTGIHAINDNYILFSCGGLFKFEDGVYDWISPGIQNSPGNVYHIWASSPANVFSVGDKGTIIHGNSNGWELQPYRNDMLFFDVTGNQINEKVYAIGRYVSGNRYRSSIVRLTAQEPFVLFDAQGVAESISLYKEKLYFVLWNDGINNFCSFIPNTQELTILYKEDTPFGCLDVFAINEMDIYFFGIRNSVEYGFYHYNGVNFKFIELPIYLEGRSRTHGIKDFLVHVGEHELEGIIYKIRRKK